MSITKFTLVTALAVAVAAFALPAAASASWTHNHVALQAGQNVQVHSIGAALFQSEAAGQVNCTEVTTTTQFTGGQTTGHLQAAEALNPQTKCDMGGILAECKITSVQATTLPWLIHILPAPSEELEVTGVHATYKLHGFLCPQHVTLQGNGHLKGEETGAVGGHTTITGLISEDQFTVTPGGKAQVKGTTTPTGGQQHTYGWTN